MEYKVIAGSLTAHTNNDGTHFANYINKKQQIAKSLCEELILHDQINIPIQDYLTACGLFTILGESGFISLLESNQIRFLRYRGQIMFVKAKHRDGSLAISAPVEPHPWSSPDDVSIEFSLNFLESNFKIKNRRKLEALLLKQTDSVNIRHCLESIREDVHEAFNHTSISEKPFDDFLVGATDRSATVHILGDSPPDFSNPFSVMVNLANFTLEAHLKDTYGCINSSSPVYFNKLIGLTNTPSNINASKNLWSITELNEIPDLGEALLADDTICQQLIKITRSSKAAEFRAWFQNNNDLNDKEIQQAFVGLVDSEPWFKKTAGSYICWGTVALTGLTFGPLAGIPLGLLNKLLGNVKGRSPKYFIDDLKKIATDGS